MDLKKEIAMRWIWLVLLLSAAGLSQAQTRSADPLDVELQRIAGEHAIDCRSGDDGSRQNCGENAIKEKQPFILRVDLSGLPYASTTVAYAQNGSGDLYMLIYSSWGWGKDDMRQCRKDAKLIADKRIILERCPKPNSIYFGDHKGSSCFPPSSTSRPVPPYSHVTF